MLIFYPQKTSSGPVIPLVLIDALASDDRYGTKEIAALVKQCAPKVSPPFSLGPHVVFSTEYEYTYSQKGVPVEAALKTEFQGMIKSPSAAFVSAFSPGWFLSAQNLDAMDNVDSAIANSQTTLVYASAVSRNADGTNVQLDFIAYRGLSVPDPFGTTTTLIVNGAGLFDKIQNVDSGFTFDKKSPLKTQIETYLSQFGFTAHFTVASQSAVPVSEKLFPPQTMVQLLNALCLQNKLVYFIDYQAKIVRFYSQGVAGTPKSSPANTLQAISFLGAGGRLILSNFTVSEFGRANFTTQFFPITIFDSVLVVNDAKSGVFEGATVYSKIGKFDCYLYYVLSYSFKWSRKLYDLQIAGTNNWLLAQKRIDEILAADVYRAALVAQ